MRWILGFGGFLLVCVWLDACLWGIVRLGGRIQPGWAGLRVRLDVLIGLKVVLRGSSGALTLGGFVCALGYLHVRGFAEG